MIAALPFILLFIFLSAVLIWFSPDLRVNYLLWRGHDKKARLLIESILEQNPDRLNLYNKLAKVYYLENRRDKKALRLYEMILKLKVPFEWRDELYTIVAKHYVMEGRKDTDAIRTIEKAIDKEIKRTQQTAF